jgi:hypothetical protein
MPSHLGECVDGGTEDVGRGHDALCSHLAHELQRLRGRATTTRALDERTVGVHVRAQACPVVGTRKPSDWVLVEPESRVTGSLVCDQATGGGETFDA